MVYYLLPFIVLLGILVFVHEFGHFLIARLCGVRVSAFSIGFGKELWSHTDKHGTRWMVSAVPLGGYCQFLGDADAASATSGEEALQKLTPEEKQQAFAFQNPFKKLAIVLGGPGFNYLFAMLVYTAVFVTVGQLSFPPLVGEVIGGSAAEEAGLQAGDRILKINGVEVGDFSEIVREINMATQPQITVDVQRGDEERTFDVVLKAADADSNNTATERRYMLGIQSVTAVERKSGGMAFGSAVSAAWHEVATLTTTTLRGIGQMLTGRRGGEDIGGVIRIAEMTGDISKNNGILDFLIFMAIISVNLGLINLLPIPVLDGGHVVFFLIEIVIFRPISEKIKMICFKIGFALLLTLMIYATWNDIVHLVDRLWIK
jgi:regulator of sigma E protease